MATWNKLNTGKPDNTDLADLDDIADRIDNCEQGLAGDKSLDSVDINGGAIDGTPIGASSTSSGAFTTITGQRLDIDNIRVDGNTVSSTNTNGDINITPNGTGSVVIAKETVTTATITTATITTANITTANITTGNIPTIDGVTTLSTTSDTRVDTVKALDRRVVKVASGSITAGKAVGVLLSDPSKVKEINSTLTDCVFIGIANDTVADTESVTISIDYYDLGSTSYVAGDMLFVNDSGSIIKATQAVTMNYPSAEDTKNVTLYIPIGYVYYQSGSVTRVMLNGILKDVIVPHTTGNVDQTVISGTGTSSYDFVGHAVTFTSSSPTYILRFQFDTPITAPAGYMLNTAFYEAQIGDVNGIGYAIAQLYYDSGNKYDFVNDTSDPGGNTAIRRVIANKSLVNFDGGLWINNAFIFDNTGTTVYRTYLFWVDLQKLAMMPY